MLVSDLIITTVVDIRYKTTLTICIRKWNLIIGFKN